MLQKKKCFLFRTALRNGMKPFSLYYSLFLLILLLLLFLFLFVFCSFVWVGKSCLTRSRTRKTIILLFYRNSESCKIDKIRFFFPLHSDHSTRQSSLRQRFQDWGGGKGGVFQSRRQFLSFLFFPLIQKNIARSSPKKLSLRLQS